MTERKKRERAREGDGKTRAIEIKKSKPEMLNVILQPFSKGTAVSRSPVVINNETLLVGMLLSQGLTSSVTPEVFGQGLISSLSLSSS